MLVLLRVLNVLIKYQLYTVSVNYFLMMDINKNIIKWNDKGENDLAEQTNDRKMSEKCKLKVCKFECF